MQFKDYYETLGVARGADAETVKRAYRKQARKYHPDVSKEKNAEEKFKNVQEAYEVLKDPEKRAAYDQLGRDYRSGQQFRPPPDWEQRFGQSGGPHRFSDLNGFSDFFSSLFGAAGTGAAGPGGSSQREADGGQIEVSIEEAYTGTRRRVTINDNGRARLVDVQIPAGVVDGQALRVGGGRAALILRVKLRPHPVFVMQGKDVQVELPLAPWEAALGAKVAVPTLGGTVELTIPAGAQAGQRLRLRGRGFPGTPDGDQFVTVKLVTPNAETPQAKEAYERMRREFNFNPRAAWP
ncbi:MAG: DnaJ domain-containing protein [Pseudomonadota bacterium]|nr:DnaJ domain-containing protein [Pseudomonadota bacterium]